MGSPRFVDLPREEFFDRAARVLLGRVGQMQVFDRGHQRGVSEVLLDDAQGNVGFQQVCREGVSQGVHRDFLAELELGGDLLDRPLSGGHAHRCLGSALGAGLERMIATVSGEEELRMLVRDPIPPQGIDGELADGDVAVLGTFAAMDVDHLALGVDVADLQVQSFAQS